MNSKMVGEASAQLNVELTRRDECALQKLWSTVSGTLASLDCRRYTQEVVERLIFVSP